MNQSVVQLDEISTEIIQVRMQDIDNKNTFSHDLMEGLNQAFAYIEQSEQYKVVVLTGYGNYFASGGTKQGLLDIYEKRVRFTDTNIYRLPLDCSLPVISAMQGHGIGGGFILGLFADFIIMGLERIYAANFIRYGFTPGMGATLIAPEKLGRVLGNEVLMTGRNYTGEELKSRGAPFIFSSSNQVLNKAYELAHELAQKPRVSLQALKKHLNQPIHHQLAAIVSDELAMHDKTFHQPEVKTQIEALFGES